MNKEELLYYFKQDLKDADSAVKDGELFSEEDDVIILYKGHYPEYTEELNKMIQNHNSFFDFGDEE